MWRLWLPVLASLRLGLGMKDSYGHARLPELVSYLYAMDTPTAPKHLCDQQDPGSSIQMSWDAMGASLYFPSGDVHALAPRTDAAHSPALTLAEALSPVTTLARVVWGSARLESLQSLPDGPQRSLVALSVVGGAALLYDDFLRSMVIREWVVMQRRLWAAASSAESAAAASAAAASAELQGH